MNAAHKKKAFQKSVIYSKMNDLNSKEISSFLKGTKYPMGERQVYRWINEFKQNEDSVYQYKKEGVGRKSAYNEEETARIIENV